MPAQEIRNEPTALATSTGKSTPVEPGVERNLSVGVVVIGRNEGERLRRCLESIMRATATAVYVDSGSSDGSVKLARTFGIEVHELDLTTPFCAARARNEGCERLLSAHENLKFIQFVDGDCELIDGWLNIAAETMEKDPQLAVVAGYLHERYPERSIYNRLGNLEWNSAPPGNVNSVGGIFMMRRLAFEHSGGFNSSVAAGEEPELCARLRKDGWKIHRLALDMAWHDLAMTRFHQWWKRMIRYGYGSSDVANRFRLRNFTRNNLRTRVWSLWLIAAITLTTVLFVIAKEGSSVTLELATCIVLGLWPAQWARISLRTWRKGIRPGLAIAYGFFIMLSYWPQMIGQALYWTDRIKNRSFRLVEYKSVE